MATAIATSVFNPSKNAFERSVGVHELSGDTIPPGAIILRTWYECTVAFTSGGAATIALSVDTGTGDLKAAAALADYSAGIHDTSTAPGSVTRLTSGGHILATVAVAALTAGSLTVWTEYDLGANV